MNAPTGLSLRKATPEDLPQLEAWCRQAQTGADLPYISVTLTEFQRHPSRGELIILCDGGAEVGYAVLSRLWSNRQRGDIGVIDDILCINDLDRELILFELKRYAQDCVAIEVRV